MEEPTTQKTPSAQRFWFFALSARPAKARHIMLEGLIWQTHRQPAVGAAALPLTLE